MVYTIENFIFSIGSLRLEILVLVSDWCGVTGSKQSRLVRNWHPVSEASLLKRLTVMNKYHDTDLQCRYWALRHWLCQSLTRAAAQHA